MGLFSSSKPTSSETVSSTGATTQSVPSTGGASTHNSTAVPQTGVHTGTSHHNEHHASHSNINDANHVSNSPSHSHSTRSGAHGNTNTVASTAGQDGQIVVDEVETTHAPAVTEERVINHLKEETVEAVDREKHVHHHQHRVQPIAAKEVLATEHEMNVVPEVTREQHVEMPAEHEARLHEQHHQHVDTRTVGETERTAAHLGSSVNEHVHHHIHEKIQPLIQKETHAHKVVHTVIPIKEVIHDAPIVHESTVLPTVSLDQYESQHGGTAGGIHGESAHAHSHFQGEPKATHSSDKNHHHGKDGVQPVHNSQALNKLDPRVDSDRTRGLNSEHHSHATRSAEAGNHSSHNQSDSSSGGALSVNPLHKDAHTGQAGVQPVHKSQALNEIDPRTDSDRIPGSTSSAHHGTGAHTGLTGEKHAHRDAVHAQGVEPAHNSRVANDLDPRISHHTRSNDLNNVIDSSVRR